MFGFAEMAPCEVMKPQQQFRNKECEYQSRCETDGPLFQQMQSAAIYLFFPLWEEKRVELEELSVSFIFFPFFFFKKKTPCHWLYTTEAKGVDYFLMV